MQNSVGFTESGQHYSRTAATDCHFRKTKRAEAKRQRNLDTIQMLFEAAFLGGALVAAYWVLHMALWLI